MHTDPNRHHRRSIRLRDYDYAQAGAFMVTICVQGRETLLGAVVNAEVQVSPAGMIVAQSWWALPERFPTIDLDAFVIMPNHLHGIVVITGSEAEGAASSAPTLGQMIRVFKSLSGIACNRALDRIGTRFWQRNYYERIIRDERELDRLRSYIENNPAQWSEDSENVDRHL